MDKQIFLSELVDVVSGVSLPPFKEQREKKPTPFFHRQAKKSFVLPLKGTLSNC